MLLSELDALTEKSRKPMPHHPHPECEVCNGTGSITKPEYLKFLRGDAGQPCACTYKRSELFRGLDNRDGRRAGHPIKKL
jgi:hypothetical protein